MQALEEWDPSLLDKHTEAIEAAILAAAQDAQSDTRAAGRLMFAVYGSTWPAPAAAMLQRVEKDRALQEKLHQALEAYRPGEHARWAGKEGVMWGHVTEQDTACQCARLSAN